MNTEKKVELLAPGGSVLAVKAAILAGADAVYCGLPSFNARSRAENVPLDQLAELSTIAHQHQCKIYLTLNILLLDGELEAALRLLDEARTCGIDAVIVADWGLLMLVRERFPGLGVHASTQMTSHNCGQIDLLGAAGVSYVNICRELSIAEVKELCDYGARCGMVTEVFVHGAWCISFSGQCTMSSVACGRSGNRGDCSQPCRRSYSIAGKRDGSPQPFFNLKDNSAFARAAALIEAGAGAFKIEGRMKSFRYVYTVVSAWRRQIDRTCAGEALPAEDPTLATVFNRSFSSGYLDGHISNDMFAPESGDLSLVKIGIVHGFTADTSTIRFAHEVDAFPETPVRIYTAGFTFVCTGVLDCQTGRFEYRLRITHKLKGKINRGDVVYRQAGEEGPSDLRERIDRMAVRKRPLRLVVSGSVGTPLTVRFLSDGCSANVASDVLLGSASSRALSKEVIAAKMGMLGETEFELAGTDCSQLDEGLFMPISVLNDLRRRGVAMLAGNQDATALSDVFLPVSFEKPPPAGVAPSLAVLVDSEEDCLLSYAAPTKVFFELPVNAGGRKEYFVELFKRHPSLLPWFPAILIGEHYHSAVALLEAIGPRLIVSDNSGIGMAAAKRGISWVAGPSPGCANSMALRALGKFGGCSGAFISTELGSEQLRTVIAPKGMSRWFTLFAPMLLMTTRQCSIRNCTGCEKEVFDEQCVATCEKDAQLLDGKNLYLYLVKRPGFYNQVFGGRYYYNPTVIASVDNDHAVFMVDLRHLPSKTTLSVARQEFISRIEQALGGTEPPEQLRSLAQATTTGNYLRGW